MTPLDRTIALDPANPLPMRVFDNGDGTYSLATHDPSGVKTRTTHITSAQLLDLHNTPVELVPNPGATKFLALQMGVFVFKPGVTPYSTTFTLSAGYSSDPAGVLNWFSADQFTTNGQYVEFQPHWSGTFGNADFLNQSLVLVTSDPLTLGDGTLDVTVVYIVVG